MRRTILACLSLAVLTVGLPVNAQAAEDADDIVRLPGAGLVKPGEGALREHARLVPGGGLFASFDLTRDGIITAPEIVAGISAAFLAADSNADGNLTALEQQAWAAGLPTRDDSLANPVRFDPNLDRFVTRAEFQGVISDLATAYRGADGSITLASLAAPEPKPGPRAFTELRGREPPPQQR